MDNIALPEYNMPFGSLHHANRILSISTSMIYAEFATMQYILSRLHPASPQLAWPIGGRYYSLFIQLLSLSVALISYFSSIFTFDFTLCYPKMSCLGGGPRVPRMDRPYLPSTVGLCFAGIYFIPNLSVYYLHWFYSFY